MTDPVGDLNALFDDMALDSLDDVKAMLAKADISLVNGRRNAAVIGVAHMRIMHANLGLTFADLERLYRQIGSQTYLLAAPCVGLPDDIEARDLNTMALSETYLWIGVNGPQEVWEQMQLWKVRSPDENLARLATSGFLLKKPPVH